MFRILAVSLLMVLGWTWTTSACARDSDQLEIGMNSSGPRDWGSEWPLVNIMKLSRTWITHNAIWISGGENAWDTGLLDQIPCDEHGYPLVLRAR
ncbi:MAG: hypothetical protein KAY24_07210 [Candidatus Eisenbacteria sp.]|nr:hypothetical protein [Candidatus Eisenbacteria bacterium]